MDFSQKTAAFTHTMYFLGFGDLGFGEMEGRPLWHE